MICHITILPGFSQPVAVFHHQQKTPRAPGQSLLHPEKAYESAVESFEDRHCTLVEKPWFFEMAMKSWET